MAKIVDEFKSFIMRGNVVDMAVGVIIGAAFGKIITSLVNDMLMPPIGLLLGKVDFAGLFINLSGKTFPSLTAAQAAGAPTLNYGVFLNNMINFLIVAFVIFLVVKQVNHLQKLGAKPVAPSVPTTKECSFCFSTIPIKAVRCAHCTSELAARV